MKGHFSKCVELVFMLVP